MKSIYKTSLHEKHEETILVGKKILVWKWKIHNLYLNHVIIH